MAAESPRPNEEDLPDIVLEAKLRSDVHPSHTIHFQTNPDSSVTHVRWERDQRPPLGKGAFTTVWLETCVSGAQQGQCRAVKEFKRTERELSWKDFSRELEAAVTFSKAPYLERFVQCLGWYQTPEMVCLAMEVLTYGDLESYLSYPFPEDEVRSVASQVLEGLQFMHMNSFAHRDLKPRNLLVKTPGPSWAVKIADFGISKKFKDTTTATRQGYGTEAYMAPEVKGLFPRRSNAQGQQNPYAADIWAVGLIVWQMITNSAAFTEPADLVAYVIYGKQRSFASSFLSTPCSRFIRHCLAPSSGDRPSAEEALQSSWTRGTQRDENRPDMWDDEESTSTQTWPLECSPTNTSIVLDPDDEAFDPQLRTLLDQGKLTEAEELSQAAVEMRTMQLGEAHPSTIVASQYLGEALEKQLRLAEATVTYRRCLSARTTQVGEYQEDTLASMMRLARCLAARNQDFEAESFYRKVIAIREQTLGQTHESTLEPIHHLAQVVGRQGKLEEAQNLWQRLLDLRSSIPGIEHTVIAETGVELGVTQYRRGELFAASASLHKALTIQEELRGFQTVEWLQTAGYLASALTQLGKLVEVCSLRRRILEATEKVHGPSTADARIAALSFATSAFSVGQFKNAEITFNHALPAQLGDPNRDAQEALKRAHMFALSLSFQNRCSEAEPTLRVILGHWQALEGTAAGDTLLMVDGLVNAMCNVGHHAEGRQEFFAVDQLRDTVMRNGQWTRFYKVEDAGPGQPQEVQTKNDGIFLAIRSVAKQLKDQNSWVEEEILRRQILQSFEHLFQENHELSIDAIEALSDNLSNQGKFDEADKLYRRVFRAKHDSSAYASFERASFLLDRGRYKEAEFYCQRWIDVDGDDGPDAMDLLANAYLHQGRAQDAEALYHRASAARGGPVPPQYTYSGKVGTIGGSIFAALNGGGNYNRLGIIKGCKSMHGYGLALQSRGQHQQAESAFRAILKILHEAYESDDKSDRPEWLSDVQCALASTLESREQHGEASSLFEAAYKDMARRLGKGHGKTLQAGYSLAGSLEKQGLADKAAQIYRSLGEE